MMNGRYYPRTGTGKASMLPKTPWHYSGDLLTVEYRTDVDAVRALLSPELELADEDPGAVAAIWADWQSCSDSFEEILDPIRCQYMEMFIVIRCKYKGKHYSRCAFIWVDKDYAIVRGQHQGYPKKLGSIHQSRPVELGKAGPKLEAGGKFGATLAAYDRRLAQATFTITGEAERPGFVNGLPMVHHRWYPSIEGGGRDSLEEVVTMSGFDGQMGRCFRGTATLEYFESPVEELTLIPPREIIGGYWHEVCTSWKKGTTLARKTLPDI